MALFYGQPSIAANTKFKADSAAKKLRRAMKGLGTDEKIIIEVLTSHNNEQRQEIKRKFKTMFGKELNRELASELGGHFEQVCLGLLKRPRDFDASCLKKAIQGAGTDNKCLLQILCTKSNEEIDEIKAAYKKLTKRSLEKDVVDDTSGDFERLLVSALSAGREQNVEVDVKRAASDAEELVAAGPGQVGTDETAINSILALRSPTQLLETFDRYEALTSKTIEHMIKDETSGALRDGFLAIVSMMRNPQNYFAKCIHDSMAGAGTDDDTLIRLLVSRSEVDLADIKKSYKNLYDKDMAKDVAGDTSGDYKKILLAIVG